MSSLLSVGFLNRGETRVDLKCDANHPLENDKLTIDTTGISNIAIQYFTKLVGIGSKSDDFHETDRTRRRTSSSFVYASGLKKRETTGSHVCLITRSFPYGQPGFGDT